LEDEEAASGTEAGRSRTGPATAVPPPQSEAPKTELLKGVPKSDEVQ
jgi:hypothetical protein